MFGYNLDKNTIYTICIVLAIVSLISIGPSGIAGLILTLPAVIVAITFHEFAHANAADKLGDTTPRNQGRLSLNPLCHLDPFGFILLMFAHIGYGKPVQINPNNFNSNKSRGFCEAMVSLAGPLMNFFIAFVSCTIYVVIKTLYPLFFSTSVFGAGCAILLSSFISVNIGLGVFNLIPLPPLDGEKIFRNILPYKAQEWLDRNYQTLYIIFMVLWIFGYLGILVSPVIEFIANGMMYCISLLVGIIL